MPHKISSKQIKLFALFSTSSAIFWVTLQVKKTREILSGAFDPYILHIVDTKNVEKEKPPLDIDAARWIDAPTSEQSFWATKWKSLKFSYARHLVSLTNADDVEIRKRATEKLAAIKDLDSWQYVQLANSCNAKTAVALARQGHADLRYLIEPYISPNRVNEEYLVHILKEFLVHLEHSSKHLCLTNFLSNSFADIQDMNKLFENYSDHADDIAKCIKSTSDMLPLCVESILHHSSIERYSRDILDNNGLYLLLEIYFRYKHAYDINVALCNIIGNLSVFPEVIDELHKSGWIAILAKWARDNDLKLSVTASRALANLDVDDRLKARYERGVYSLHPTMRTEEPIKVDVVFIHGLLGGVFYTWRQRDRQDSALSIIETITGEPEVWSFRKYCGSDPILKDYMERYEEQNRREWEDVGKDFEIVSYDIPIASNKQHESAFFCTDYDKVCCMDGRTRCWPKDWLTSDCSNLRVIGVNYDTALSKWAGTCPDERSILPLEERTEELMEKLKRAGVGSRPIVWVTHSMGGLLVKNIICKAHEYGDYYRKIVENTRGIVFYSTPHRGSKIATLNQPTSLVVLPSIEVQELREESPRLKEIHAKFLEIIKGIPVQVISFIETKSTVVTALKFNFLLVEPNSGNPGVGEVFEVPLDHLGICKPCNRESFLYQKVLHLVRHVLDRETNEKLHQNEHGADERVCNQITG